MINPTKLPPKQVKVLVVIAIILFLLFSVTSIYSSEYKPKQAGPLNILFVGNSFTSYNGGINKQLEGIVPSTQTVLVAPGGFNLQNHWNGEARKKIQEGKWNYVILQEQSQLPVLNQGTFFQYAKLLDQEIRKAGAITVFLMTWERPDSVSYGVTTENLVKAYREIGRQIGAMVAPAGIAFSLSMKRRPNVSLYSNDGHPTIQGTYLAACVLCGTIIKRSPVGNPFAGNINEDIRKYLQQIASESVGI